MEIAVAMPIPVSMAMQMAMVMKMPFTRWHSRANEIFKVLGEVVRRVGESDCSFSAPQVAHAYLAKMDVERPCSLPARLSGLCGGHGCVESS